MTPTWAQRQEELRSDCIVSPDGRCLTGVDVLFSVSVSATEYPQRDRVAS
jgi:hypothetical protein